MSGRRTGMLVALAAVAGCAGILGYRDRSERPFPHRAHLREGIGCPSCHRGAERAGDVGPLHLPGPERCVACHTKPHDPSPCGGCHGDPAALGAASEARAHLKFSHARHVPVLKGNCARCHDAGDDTLMRPRMATCLGCHQHEEEFEQRRCDGCHVDVAAEGVLPQSHVVHDGDWLREHGVRAASQADLCSSCHSERSCASCHGVTAAALPARLAFDQPFGSALHRAGFLARHADDARAAPGTCTACHAPARCESCHVARGVAGAGARSPHPTGWVGLGPGDGEHGRAARRDPASCAGCHGGAGEMLCVGCHKVGGIGGSVHPAGWSSDRPMTSVPCRLCHQP